MRRKSRVFKAILFLAVLGAVMLGLSAVASAWSEGNPPEGVGTHDWIISAAKVVADSNRPGSAGWLDFDVAQSFSHYPDEVYKDSNNHAYDVWGLLRLGNAPNTVKSHWTLAVRALQVGDTWTASKEVGLMAHYFDDICNPWHTTYEFSNLTVQTKYHSVYENDVLGHEPATVTPDGYQTVTDAATATKNAATFSHNYYTVLASAYIKYGTAGYHSSPTIDSTTKMLLGKAANGLADLITSIQIAAGYKG